MAKIVQNFPSLNNRGKVDNIVLFDTIGEFADSCQAIPSHMRGSYTNGNSWNGGEGFDTTAKKCRTGDMSRVAASDAFMAKMEELTGYSGSAFETQNVVSGGAPNVAAFLAGQPLNMRLRRRVESEKAPLNIVVDIVSSGGIEARDLERRGAAILALVRVLSAIRPVSLYISAAALPYGDTRSHTARAVAFKLDSTPLDLARAAHALCAVGVSRQMAYAAMAGAFGTRQAESGLNWSYDSIDFQRKNGKAFWQRSFGMDEMLYIAAPYVTDTIIKKPDEWLKQMIAEYGKPNE